MGLAHGQCCRVHVILAAAQDCLSHPPVGLCPQGVYKG